MKPAHLWAFTLVIVAWSCGSGEKLSSASPSDVEVVEARSAEPSWRGPDLWEPAFEGEEIPLETPFLGVFPAESARDAIPIYERILGGVKALFGAKDLRVARGLVFLATLHESIGELGRTEQRYRGALEIVRERYPRHADHGGVANNFGLFYARQAKPVEALPLFREAVEVAEGLDKGDEQNLPIALQNLATAHWTLGELSSAQRHFLLALTAQEALSRPDPRRRALLQQNFALLVLSFGEAERARRLLEAASSAASHLTTTEQAAMRNSLAEALLRSGQLSDAEGQLQQGLGLAKPEGPLFATILGNLGRLHQQAGAFDRAEGELARALALLRAQGRAGSPTAVAVVTNLAMTRLGRGEHGAALAGIEEALATWTREPTGSPAVTAGLLETLAAIQLERGDRNAAVENAQRARQLREGYLEAILAAGSEEQRLASLSSAAPYDLLANLREPVALATAALRSKGAVLDALIEDRRRAFRSTGSKDHELLDRIAALKRRRMALWLAGPGDLADAAERERIEQQLSEAERLLSEGRELQGGRRSAGRVTLRDAQSALERDEALVDFIRYRAYRGKGKVEDAYGAVVLPATGHPRWVPLEGAAALDAEIQALRRLLRCATDARAPVPLRGPCADATGSLDQKVSQSLGSLAEAIWRPLEGEVPAGVRRLFLSPDGELHFVPFFALRLKEGAFLGERFVLSSLTSGRDLLEGRSERIQPTVLVYALRSDGSGPRRAIALESLPGARAEAELVRSHAEAGGWRVEVRLDERATEDRLRREAAPGILHLATHAHFVDELSPPGLGPTRGLPMARGFLLLAGGGAGLDAWRRGGGLPLESDGLLTAEEVTELPLSDTWLAVLSACETGAGEARAAEGVLGLRRGFALAGVRHLVFSLWPVGDRPTTQLMGSFYEQLFRERDPALALNRAQVERFQRVRRGGSLFAAVQEAAAFVASSSGSR